MGAVYKVEDKEIKEVVALKLLKKDIASITDDYCVFSIIEKTRMWS